MKSIEIAITVGNRTAASDGRKIWSPTCKRQIVLGTYESDAAGMANELLRQAKIELDRMIDEKLAMTEKKPEKLEEAVVTLKAELAKWSSVATAMFQAQDAYGCGFYGDDDWLRNYNLLKSMCGYTSRDDE